MVPPFYAGNVISTHSVNEKELVRRKHIQEVCDPLCKCVLYTRRVKKYLEHTGSMWLVQTEGWKFDQKLEFFFVCVFSKKYMGIVWDTQRGVHPPEVVVRDEQGGWDTQTTRRSDLLTGSISLEAAGICLVRGVKGQRPAYNPGVA